MSFLKPFHKILLLLLTFSFVLIKCLLNLLINLLKMPPLLYQRRPTLLTLSNPPLHPLNLKQRLIQLPKQLPIFPILPLHFPHRLIQHLLHLAILLIVRFVFLQFSILVSDSLYFGLSPGEFVFQFSHSLSLFAYPVDFLLLDLELTEDLL